MKEQEKAEEILLSYKCYTHEHYGVNVKSYIDINTSKSNAIKAVNLVLESQHILLDRMDIFELNELRKYWKEVKAQIAESNILENE